MKFLNQQDTKYRIIILVIFVLIVFFYGILRILFIPSLPETYSNGFGWDGVYYAKMTEEGLNFIQKHEIASYRAKRFVPSMLVYFALKLSGENPTPSNIIFYFKVLHTLCNVLASIGFFLIAVKRNWNHGAFIVALTAGIFHFNLVTYLYYNTVLTDSFAFLVAVFLVVGYVYKNYSLLIILIIIGGFTWPLLDVIAGLFLLAAAFENNTSPRFTVFSLQLAQYKRIIQWLPAGTAVLVGLAGVYLFVKYRYVFGLHTFDIYTYFIYPVSVLTVMFQVYLLAFLFLQAHSTSTIQLILNKKFIILFFGLIILFTLIHYTWSVIYPFRYDSDITEKYDFKKIYLGCLFRLPFIGILDTFLAFGMLVSAFFFNIRRIFQSINNIFIIIILFLAFLFILKSESRHLLIFWPLIVLLTVPVLRTEHWGTKQWVSFVLLTVLFSKAWYPLSLASGLYNQSNTFPAQHFFMHLGPWISRQMYIVLLIISLILNYFIYKHFLQNTNRSNLGYY